MIQSALFETVIASIKTSLSVMLVMLWGYLSRYKDLLSKEGESNISKLGTTLFLPFLLFSEIGPLATPHNLITYWPIVVLALFFQFISLLFGGFGHYVLKLPAWIIPCIVFNNVTALPLAIITGLSKSGALDALVGPNETVDEMSARARVYILLYALVGNLCRFALGPYLMHDHPIAWSHHEDPSLSMQDPKTPYTFSPLQSQSGSDANLDFESAPLLGHYPIQRTALSCTWSIVKKVAKKASGVLNPPLIGGLLAIFCGVTPGLSKWLFEREGWLNPFTTSVSNLGHLYTALQMFVLGAHLYSKKGTKVKPLALVYLFAFRFGLMPVISCGTIFFIRRVAPGLMTADPVLDFIMSLSPVGPPALTLAAIADMADLSSADEGSISRTIMISYAFTPLIAWGVTASLAMVDKTGVGK